MPLVSKSFLRSLTGSDLSREVFARMLWRAFPGDTENEVADRAAPVLGIGQRQVRRLLRRECSAKVGQVLAVTLILGVEETLTLIYGREPRDRS